MKPKKHRGWNYAQWQTIFTAGLFTIGVVYTAAAILQWQAMREQSRRMEEQSRAMAQQLDIMRSELESSKSNRSADFILRFDEKLDKEPYRKLSHAIQDNRPILKEHGGRFTSDELEGYLDIFESLHDVWTRGLITEEMLDSAYSYEIMKAANSSEVQAYLSGIRREDSDFYSGFDDLAKRMKARGR